VSTEEQNLKILSQPATENRFFRIF